MLASPKQQIHGTIDIAVHSRVAGQLWKAPMSGYWPESQAVAFVITRLHSQPNRC